MEDSTNLIFSAVRLLYMFPTVVYSPCFSFFLTDSASKSSTRAAAGPQIVVAKDYEQFWCAQLLWLSQRNKGVDTIELKLNVFSF